MLNKENKDIKELSGKVKNTENLDETKLSKKKKDKNNKCYIL